MDQWYQNTEEDDGGNNLRSSYLVRTFLQERYHTLRSRPDENDKAGVVQSVHSQGPKY
jgi:hypothetical protein